MPAYISPFDSNYIWLKRAAVLIVQDQAGVDPDEFMEMVKHVIFAREFERAETAIHGRAPADDGDRRG